MKDILIILVCFGGLFVLVLLPIILMWVSVAKKGDERRKMIMEKTCTELFFIHILMILFNEIGRLFPNVPIFHDRSSDIVQVAVICMVFHIQLYFNKRKYGN